MIMFAETVMELAKKRYNQGGWDVIVECWDLEGLTNLLETSGSEENAWEMIYTFVDVWTDRQDDARNSAF